MKHSEEWLGSLGWTE